MRTITIEVSDETYEKIKGQVETDKTPRFEPVESSRTKVSVSDGKCILLGIRENYWCSYRKEMGDRYDILDTSQANKIIKAIQSAIDFVEKNR